MYDHNWYQRLKSVILPGLCSKKFDIAAWKYHLVPGNFILSLLISIVTEKTKKGELKIPELPNNLRVTKVKRFSKVSTSYHIISVLFDRN
jgi:hypothetical protein